MSDSSALISIVVPVYNAEKYISRCLNSVRSQTFQDFELIVVDDGSTDESLSICRKFAETDSRIQVFHKENGGLSSARNFGVTKTSGKFIVFLDADDMISSVFLEKMFSLQEKHDADVVSCLFKSFSSDAEINVKAEESSEKIFNGAGACRALFVPDTDEKNMILTAAWGKLIKKELVTSNPFPEGRNHEDVAVIYKYLYYSKTVVSTTEKLYLYYFNENGITRTAKTGTLHDDLWARKERALFFKTLGEAELSRLARNNYGELLLNYILSETLKRDELGDYYSYFRKNNPFHSILGLKLFLAYNFPLLSKFLKKKKQNLFS